MGISAKEAAHIHLYAQMAEIPDGTVEAWTVELGGPYAAGDIIKETGGGAITAASAREIGRRIKTWGKTPDAPAAPAKAAPQAPTASTEPGATGRQVEYITDLLCAAIRNGSGPIESHWLLRRTGAGHWDLAPDLDKIRALTKRQASTEIEMLKVEH